MSARSQKSNGKAIVIGASMAGLLAACALANHFEEVILVERDTFPEPGKNRKGVPQGKHTHVLLARGLKIIENFLPGLTDELLNLGAVPVEDVSRDVRWFKHGSYHKPGISGISAVGVSRPTLEAAVREQVLAKPNIRVIEGCNVKKLVTSENKQRILGVHVVHRLDSGFEESLMADLVVDSSGRGSRSSAWLENLGYQRPEEQEIHVGVGYTSCFFHRRPDQIPSLQGIVVMATPPDKRIAVLTAQDGNRWVVTIGGYLNDHAPTDMPGFLEFAKNLPTPDIYQVIRDAQPINSPVPYKFASNLRRRYEKLENFPKGYLVFGDALCSFNPIYAQGMTVAAMEAVALKKWLEEDQKQLARNFFQSVTKIIDLAWSAAVGNDLSYPEIEGPRTPMTRFLNKYIDKVHIAAHRDAQVSIAFLKMINMVAPPFVILHPRIIWRVLKSELLPGKRESQSSLLPVPLSCPKKS